MRRRPLLGLGSDWADQFVLGLLLVMAPVLLIGLWHVARQVLGG